MRRDSMNKLMATIVTIMLLNTNVYAEELTEFQKWLAKPGAEVEEYVQATRDNSDGTWRIPDENLIMKKIDDKENFWFVLNTKNCWVFYVRGDNAEQAFYNYTSNTSSYGFNFAGREDEIMQLKLKYGIIKSIGEVNHS